MIKYYTQYDLWEDPSLPPTVQKKYIEAESKSAAFSKIQLMHEGKKINIRVCYPSEKIPLNDNKKVKNIKSSIILFLVGLCSLFILLANTIRQISGSQLN